MRLSRWQRIKRRLSLPGGSFTHPDGTIELDFHAKAGIDPTVDSPEIQDAKLARYFARLPFDRRRNFGALLIAAAVTVLGVQIGMPFWQSGLLGITSGIGLYLLATGRWPN